jgi:O-antigen ligase
MKSQTNNKDQIVQRRESGLRFVSLIAMMILAFILPFELEKPLLHVGTIDITNVEVALGLVLSLSFAQWLFDGRPSLPIPRSWMWLGIVFIGALLFSGLTAPVHRSNALTAMMRTVSGIALMLATGVIVRSKRDVRLVTLALLAGISVSALIGILEVVSGDEFVWLRPFRGAPSVSGAYVRLSGSFDYANQAAMYIEAALPLCVAMIWVTWLKGRRLLAIIFAFASLLLIQAAVSTYSRSAIGVILIFIFGFAAGIWWWNQRHDQKIQKVLLLLIAGSGLLVVVNLLANPVFGLRFSSEGDVDWYLADLTVPAELRMISDQEKEVTVTLTNDGRFVWRSRGTAPVLLAARWVHPESEKELTGRPRWPLPNPVKPGETVTMQVTLRAPIVSGEFELVWDLVQESVIWFGAKTGRETTSQVYVQEGEPIIDDFGRSALESGELVEEWEYAAPIPGRFTLWKAGWDLWQDRPLQGIGLDNFRLRYGEVLGYDLWNETIHSNNWYIETLVSVGLIGAIPFFLWLALLGHDILRRLGQADVWTIAIGVALLAFLLHGLLDYFLLFNASGLLFWMLVGMWASLTHQSAVNSESAA